MQDYQELRPDALEAVSGGTLKLDCPNEKTRIDEDCETVYGCPCFSIELMEREQYVCRCSRNPLASGKVGLLPGSGTIPDR